MTSLLSLEKTLSVLFYEHSQHVSGLFREFDVNQRGFITESEFIKGIRNRFQIEISPEECHQFFQKHVQSIDGRFHFRDFAQFVVAVNKESFSLYSASYTSSLLGHRVADATLAPPHEMLSIERKRQLLMEALHEKIRQHKKDLKSIFLEFDKSRNGYLTVEEMEKGLRSIGVKIIHADAVELFHAYDRDKSNHIDFNEFVRLSSEYEKGKAFDGSWLKELWEHADEKDKASRSKKAYTDFSAKAGGPEVNIPDDISDEELITLLTDYLSFGKKVLHDVFHSWDHEGSGHISTAEFVSGMHRIGYHITEKRANALINRFDTERDGTLKYFEFVRMVSKACQSEEADLTPDEKEKTRPDWHPDDKQVLADIVETVYARPQGLKKTFLKLDRDGDGIISATELVSGMKKMGIKVSPAVANRLIKNFDSTGMNTLNYHAFVRFLSGNRS
eukprot:TRINITY_DN81724_c0_g1_i1.p1 TRINITY_DN81724_c0_g1~~TRINITY_DN81724_c0_g1_i1.p1  ORF type:complete len:446 (-),score=123.87 TRINITY_DN81724_c0_g1_i1:206-1543(-)